MRRADCIAPTQRWQPAKAPRFSQEMENWFLVSGIISKRK
jgi:hypothetical protein